MGQVTHVSPNRGVELFLLKHFVEVFCQAGPESVGVLGIGDQGARLMQFVEASPVVTIVALGNHAQVIGGRHQFLMLE